MAVNVTTISSIERTGDSAFFDPDTIVEKINTASTLINFLEAHLVLLKAKIARERESRRTSHSTVGECTEISQTFYDRVLQLWTATQNHKIRIQNETNKLYNVLAPGLMGQPSIDPVLESFRTQILKFGDMITPLYIIQMELVAEKEELDRNVAEKHRELINLIDEVGDQLEQRESQTHPREIQVGNQRLMKVKIARSVINSLFTRSRIDLEQNPDLVDLKIKWKHPISLKLKST